MNRRDLLKMGFLTTVMSLCGCKKVKTTNLDDKETIIPKQTGTYIFSAPMPFSISTIDALCDLNQKYKKSQIKTLFNNTPMPLSSGFNAWMQVNRGYNFNVKNYNDFAKYVKASIEKGFSVCYLLNAPKAFSEKDYSTFKKDFIWLLGYLKDIGIKDIKVGNTQTATLINEIDNSFNLSASTALEYHSVTQYDNLVEMYPNMDLFDIAIDENQNFHFLRNLRKLFPKIAIEVMVDESCMKGCPARIPHISELTFCRFDCQKIKQDDPLLYAFKYSRVYPWNLEYYSAIGVNNFKFSAAGHRIDFSNLKELNDYLECVENGPETYLAHDFVQNFLLTPNTIR